MKIVLNLVKILIFILALFVLTQNSGQYVQIKLLASSYSNVNLLIVIIVSLTAGAMIGAVFMAFSLIQSQSRMKALQHKNRQLLTELENLRNLSIEEIPEDDTPMLTETASKNENQN